MAGVTVRRPARSTAYLVAGGLVAGLLVVSPTVTGIATAAAVESYSVPASGVLTVTGSGWGHGRGLSQWGAYQAAKEGATTAQILAFYYPGTTLATRPAASVRVLLAGDTGRDLVVRRADRLRLVRAGRADLALGRPAGCASTPSRWRLRAVGRSLRLDAYCGHWQHGSKVGKSATFATPAGVVATQDGSIRRGYRGTVSATWIAKRSVRVVNTVPMEQYLRSVVAAEVSPSWPAAALRAQAVAARSYAAASAAFAGSPAYDVEDGIRSQAYPAAVSYLAGWKVARVHEHPATDQAIAQTAGLYVMSGTQVALTQFSASNGGATAASPVAWMVARADPWDARAATNPRLRWTRTVSVATLTKRYGLGSLRAVQVLGREGAGPFGGRVTAVRLVGTASSRTITGDSAIRAALGLHSTMFTLTTR